MFIRSSYADQNETDSLAVFDQFKSHKATNIYNLIRRAAQTESCVIITGEIYTGKRWTARCIHLAGEHTGGPFHEFSCLALSHERVRRELFGRIKHTREGIEISHHIFQKAHGGTLLIADFNHLPTEMQMHLVSIMEQISTQDVINQNGDLLDVQMILTLDNSEYLKVKEEDYWKRLVERINPLFIHEPPLRERREDIPALMPRFLKQLSNKYKVPQPDISLEALYYCIKYNWPGNLRQLRNAAEYALIISDSLNIERKHLPEFIKHSSHPLISLTNGNFIENHSLLTAEKNLFREAIKLYNNIDQVADKLGIKKGTIVNRLEFNSSTLPGI